MKKKKKGKGENARINNKRKNTYHHNSTPYNVYSETPFVDHLHLLTTLSLVINFIIATHLSMSNHCV